MGSAKQRFAHVTAVNRRAVVMKSRYASVSTNL